MGHGTTPARPVARRAAALACVLATIAGAVVLGAAPAGAAGDGPVVVPVVGEIRPVPADGPLLAFTAAGELAASVSGPAPLAVVAPDGRDFLRISGRGVDLDAAHPFTYESRTQPGVSTRLPDGVRPGSPPRWVHVSDDVSWHWYDPRTRPAAVRAPAGDRSGASEVLATWSVPMRVGDVPVAVDGRLELRQGSGPFRTTTGQPVDGLGALVSPGDPPSVVLQAPAGTPVTVLGLDGEPFLRRGADGGWEADLASRTYRTGLLRAGGRVPAGSGWVRYAEPGPVNWADERPVPPVPVADAARVAGVPADVWRWEIPVQLGGRRAALTGVVRYVPDTGAAGGSATGALPVAGLAAAVLLLAAAVVALLRRNRRLDAQHARTPEVPPAPGESAPAREGAPLP